MITIASVKAAVEDWYGLPRGTLEASYGTRDISTKRHVAMFLARRMTTKSLRQIGRSFGGKDHSTVYRAIRHVERLCASDPGICGDLHSLSTEFDFTALSLLRAREHRIVDA